MIKKYSLVLATFLCFVLSGFGQVSENFDGFTNSGYGNYSHNNFDINNGLSETTNARSGRAVRLRNAIGSNLEYVGADGNGKDGGVGVVSFWYRSWDASPTAIYNVEISVNNGAYTTVGAQIITSSTVYTQWTHTLNNSSDNIKVRVIRVNGERLIIDDFEITDYIVTGPTVTYNGNGNTGGSVPTDTNNPYTSGDTVTVLGNTGSLTNTCNTFNNWNTAADGSGTTYNTGNTFTITANTTLYAQWTSTANTVTFNANGGTGTMSPQTDCNAANLTSNTFTYTGFTFNSWNTAADGSGTTYLDGASYSFASNITLYAQWDVYVGPWEDFEIGSKPSYGTGNVTCTAGSWNFNDALIGTSGSDRKNGLQSARIRNTGAVSMNFDINTGIGNINILHAVYGTNGNSTWRLEASTDSGTSWTAYISPVITSSSTTLTNQSFTLNIGGNIRFRIVKLSGGGNRINIDDIYITPYSPTPEPEIEIQGNGTEIVNGDVTPDVSDDTDFGNVAVVGATNPHTFTIYNTGSADLTISNVTSSNNTEFTISGTTNTTISAGNDASFTVTFDPNTIGTRTSTITITSDDADEGTYTFAVEGNGTNSTTSDIIVNGTFIYNSNIDYTAYQAATITNTGQSVDVFKFDIRDGGASTDSDNLTTQLTDIVFNVVNIANIRSAALFNGNAMVDNNPVIAGNTISFSGLTYAAPDNGTAALTLRVTFLTTVTDNDQMQFTISSATANPSGSLFGTADAGGATSSLTGNRNRIEVTADRLNFLQQPSTTSTNATMTPAVQVEATDIHGNRDLDWTGNISITSTGTMTGDPITTASVSSVSTFNGVIHTVSGTGLTLTASASGLINDTSTLFDIILFTFNSGDFRPKYATDFSYNGDWEYYNGSAWVNVPDGNAPQNTSVGITRILIDKYVTGGGSASHNYDCDILLLSGGTLELLENDNPPIASEFLSAGNTLEVRNGANLIIRGDIDLPSSANLIVRSGGYMTIDQSSMTNDHPIWDGVEKFEGGSTLEINDWNWTITPSRRSLVNITTAINDNDNGYKFGNVYFNPTNLTDNWTIIGGPINVNVTENNFEINNTSNYFVLGMSNKAAGVSSTYNGNILVSDGNFTFGGSFSNDTFNQDILIRGDVIINSDDDFYVHHAFNGTPTIVGGSAPVIIEGNLEIGLTVNMVNSDVTTKEILFSGNTNHTIEIAPNCTNVPFVIESGDTGTLLNENLKFTGDSSLEVESGATFDFSFNGTTALEVQDVSGARNAFISRTNSTLYITHPQGIWDSSAQGNVQNFGATYTTYNQTANFYYVGKQNQVTGDALTVGSTVKNVFVVLDNDNLELRLTNRTGISDGGKLEIQRGIVIGEEAGVNDNDFYGPDGQLIMTGGEYRISTITANPLTDYLPQLRKYSSYNLSAGTIHLNGDNDIQILSGVPTYHNLAYSGINTLSQGPPLPPLPYNYKGISSAVDIINNVTISEDAIVDVENWTFGGATTNLIMEDNARYVTAGSGTKPDARGTYTFGPNTTIEFNNNSGLEEIRLTNPVPAYANIVVSGSDVGTVALGTGANSFIQFQPGGSFTVTDTGIFKLANSYGFNGANNTAISNVNNPTITLEDASTVEYFGADQPITLFNTNNFATNDYYANVTISGTGTKTLGHPTDVFVGEDLNVNASTLLIDENEAITVDESVNVNASASFNILNAGSLVQVDDTGINTGNISMLRNTNIKRLDYVYWSSPISGFNVNSISPGSPTNRIYKWNPVFNNTNGTLGNWIPATGETMQIGEGYIVRGPNSYTDTAANFTATFNNGTPFNGVVPVTVQRGNLAGVDDQWNLIGNPYPSAVDVFAFLDYPANAVLDGFVNFWTHGNNPSTIVADPYYDNFGSNYTATDYIAYNATGAGNGPGHISIAAGQSFMVNLLDTAPVSTTIEFNNAMRSKDYDNSQFYRTTQPNYTSSDKHRIWLDLVSETQGTNRILVGYVEGATMERDRMYDAITSVSSVQNLYSLINETPFIIQGRTLPFVDTDVIPLGINIVEQGNYHIAIAFVDGLFETDNQTVYLKDNLLGFIHNLNDAPYSFTSETGKFNERFEIVFRDSFLSLNEEEITANNISIIELQSGEVQLTVPNQHEIQTVEIIDILGRTIYNLKGNGSAETYNLSNLSQAAYIAKITLANGQVLIKKAVKRK